MNSLDSFVDPLCHPISLPFLPSFTLRPCCEEELGRQVWKGGDKIAMLVKIKLV
jgi:hypothetical protein